MRKKVSVIIPAYNEEDYLAAALESAESQTMDHEELEVIVVNNASTDDTVRVYRSFFMNNSIQNFLFEEPLWAPAGQKTWGPIMPAVKCCSFSMPIREWTRS